MVRRRKKTVRRPTGKFYAFIGVVAAAVIAVVFLITNIQTATIETGELQFEMAVPVVIVRDEQVVSEENYGKANYLVQEGTRVEADSPVAEVFKWGYNDKISYELLEKQTSIQEYQENALMSDTSDTNLAGLNQNIVSKAQDINQMIQTPGTGDILLAERELKELMRQKREYLNETVAADRKLEEYFGEEQQLQERVDSAREVAAAPQTGVVSYYFDGAEDALNANNLQEIISADIDDILNGTTAVQSDAPAEEAQGAQPLYRLVNNFKWYILIDTDEAMKEFAQGNVFQVAFDDFLSRQYEGTVVGHIAEESGYIYVIEVLDDIGELLSTRRTDARVLTRFEGLKVPEEALQAKNDETGVTVVNGGEKTFVPVEVQIIKDGSAIVVPADGQGGLSSGMQVEV